MQHSAAIRGPTRYQDGSPLSWALSRDLLVRPARRPRHRTKMLHALYPNPSARDCSSLRAAVPRERETTQPTSDVKNSKADKARSRATMTSDTCSNKDQRTIGRCQGDVGERPLQVVRPPQQLREQLRTNCQHDVRQQAKMSYHPRDHA